MRYTITLSSEQALHAGFLAHADGLRTGAWIAALVKRELARRAKPKPKAKAKSDRGETVVITGATLAEVCDG